MKALISETDSSAVEGEIFHREAQSVSIDDQHGLLYIHGTDSKIKEIINMTSKNFHSVTFIEE